MTVYDNSGICFDSVCVFIDQPATSVTVNINEDSSITCFGFSDAGITANPSGGTPSLINGYTYTWDNGVTIAGNSNINAGQYCVTVTDSLGCSAGIYTVTEPSAVTASIPSSVSVSCFGESTGSALAQGAGGTPTYTYLWDVNASNQTSANANGLATGSYFVTVTDANLCSSTANVSITQPATAVSGLINTDSTISCFGGSNGGVHVLESGGTPLLSIKPMELDIHTLGLMDLQIHRHWSCYRSTLRNNYRFIRMFGSILCYFNRTCWPGLSQH